MARLRILVVIANYGTKNDQYLRRLLEEYQSMSYDVHLAVFTNVPKELGEQVEVVVETPRGDPWGFPFALRRILAERSNDYDLFIYTEDDTLITQRNIDAFLQVSEVLPEDEIAGFIRSEKGPGGETFISTAHAHFHWDPHSVAVRGPYVFAFFTNEHSGCYLLTQAQLKRAIQSRGFLVGPHQGRYHLPETAATDPYTQCGFRKVICISQIEYFILPHLPNKYFGKLGLRDTEFFRQIQALEAIQNKTRPCTVLLNSETKVWRARWSKSYYEPSDPEVLALIPEGTQTVLSYGCGWGAIESDLLKRGIGVTAVALDSVIGACAEAKGIEVLHGDSETALASLAHKRFDCVLIPNVLHLVSEPVRLLESLAKLLSDSGVVIATLPNLAQLPVLWTRVKRSPAFRDLGSFERSGLHLTSYRRARRWFTKAKLTVRKIVPVIPRRAQGLYIVSGGLLSAVLASHLTILGEKA
jgi:2-polyprenyl-3-methyl-5-hydroxy-6-metoxy-1,4-benzoquinol methylase